MQIDLSNLDLLTADEMQAVDGGLVPVVVAAVGLGVVVWYVFVYDPQ